MIRVCIAGVTGWVGSPLATAIQESNDLELVAAVARRAAGERVGDVVISGTVEEALRTPSEVFVDYTSASAVKANVLAAIEGGRHVIVGSSGLTDEDYAEIDSAARLKNVGVIAVGNFSITAALLQRFAAEAAKYLRSWEIIDYAHAGKVDAPSGTAREIAWRLSEVRPDPMLVPLDETVGARESRGATISGTQVHSVRLPGYTIGVEVRFGRDDDRLTMTYEGGTGAGPYIGGTLLAIRRVHEITGLARGLDRVL